LAIAFESVIDYRVVGGVVIPYFGELGWGIARSKHLVKINETFRGHNKGRYALPM
jgi:hypothetical protein